MNRALEKVWQRPITRFWVHTCTLDHPNALAFYMRSGFVPFRRQIEIAPDPAPAGRVIGIARTHTGAGEIIFGNQVYRRSMQTLTTAQAVVSMLELNGIDTLFCLPGVQNDAFFDALYDRTNAIRPIHARHEQACAYMALGYAMASGKPSAYVVVPGPGLPQHDRGARRPPMRRTRRSWRSPARSSSR